MEGESQSRTRPSIEELMIRFDVNDEDLAINSRALHTQSHEGKKTLDALPADFKARVDNFYRYLRQTYGIQPNKLNEHGKMTYFERVSYEEAWNRALKDREKYPVEDTPF